MTSTNNTNTQFARSITPRVAAKAADARPSLLPASAATSIDHRQHGLTHERGRGVPELGMLSRASIPADGRQVHRVVAMHFLRLPSLYDVSLRLGRRLRAGGSFQADRRGCSPSVANINDAVDHLLHNRSYRFPSHSSAPSSVSKQHGTEGVGSDQKIHGVSQNVVDC